jgi:hypothetical protein
MTLIEGDYAKLQRAHEHLNELVRIGRPFVQRHRDRASYRFDSETAEHVIEFAEGAPPLRFGVLIGDLAHALRTCLNNIATRYAGQGVEFPIYLPTHKGLGGKLLKFPDHFQKVVSDFQPGNAGYSPPCLSPLWAIHRLNVIDKHEGIVIPPLRFRISDALGDIRGHRLNERGNHEVRFVGSTPKVDLKPEVSLLISLAVDYKSPKGPDEILLSSDVLNEMYLYVEMLIFPAVAALPEP